MKNKYLYLLINLLLFMFSFFFSNAQKIVTAPSCYDTYKSKGDTYKNQNNYNQALQQYQLAKNCNYLTNAQRKEIDDLISQMNKQLQGQTNQKQSVPAGGNIKRVYIPPSTKKG
ncbi:MAG: hypothetical protein M3342_00100 [Bacteroidota bacterium]|nr:hypothetical protein [Bacteroidota bacterium]